MNKQQTFFLFFWLFCLIVTDSHAQNRPIDTSKSIVRWKGTKLAGTGKHEGTLALKSGYLLFEAGKLTGGKFIADMHTIRITDIPPDDYIPIRDLTNHLESDFETQKYPEAIFLISEVSPAGSNKSKINGNLTIRSVTRKISFVVEELKQGQYSTLIRINRADWGIGEKDSWLEKKLVDPEIEMQISVRL